ncbi:HEAT repeat domain-containing protein [Mycetocola zhadangensis]|uniref:HEAT repeat domain-containing protein n=1 Tax=Mycetocola zhadangensis TaxID=1164595 RepID=A0A3L7ITN3_9MICO|nr:HEAT repeat domain-containing protein [Mycetocola zhadangensis]
MDLAVTRFGEAGLVTKAIGLLEGRNEGDDVLLYVGGRHAQGVLDGAPALYWPELWGARTLLHIWSPSAEPAVLAGTTNQAWRVREMCLRVCAERRIGDETQFAKLTTDENPRVRAAAGRALAEIGTAASEEALQRLLRDPQKDVRRATGESLSILKERLS